MQSLKLFFCPLFSSAIIGSSLFSTCTLLGNSTFFLKCGSKIFLFFCVCMENLTSAMVANELNTFVHIHRFPKLKGRGAKIRRCFPRIPDRTEKRARPATCSAITDWKFVNTTAKSNANGAERQIFFSLHKLNFEVKYMYVQITLLWMAYQYFQD